MGETLNTLALTAKQDELAREKLIKSSRQTILRSASSAARRYITENDDEWSIAMYAFSRAVDAYSPEKGDFLPFAQMLIHRSLIDYYRAEARHIQELPSPLKSWKGTEKMQNLTLSILR